MSYVATVTIIYKNGNMFSWDYLFNTLCKRLCCREKLSHMLEEEEKSGKVEKATVYYNIDNVVFF
jgi:hypothetical protein